MNFILYPGDSAVSQIVEQVERMVALGVQQPGDELPGAGTLAAELGVSRVTVQKAYGVLIERNIAEGRVGYGTYIASNADTRPDVLRKFMSLAILLGQNLYLSQSEILEAFEAEIARHFAREDDDAKPQRKESLHKGRRVRSRAKK